MLTASRVLTRAQAGEPLPVVFRSLDRRGIRPRRGQITMVAGQTNAGKSMWSLYYALRLSEQGERVLYFSADSDEHTQGTRMAAMITGQTTESVEEGIKAGGQAYYEDALGGVDLRMDFNSNPTLDDIDLTVAAYEELHGAWPTVIIVDNLINVEGYSGEGDSEKHGLMEIQRVLKHICRQTSTAILLMHHCSEAEGRPYYPPTRRRILQKVNDLPENILTIAYDPTTEQFGIAAVKLRNGKADPEAREPVWLAADMDRCRFADTKIELITMGSI